jgi:hypothetical protein
MCFGLSRCVLKVVEGIATFGIAHSCSLWVGVAVWSSLAESNRVISFDAQGSNGPTSRHTFIFSFSIIFDNQIVRSVTRFSCDKSRIDSLDIRIKEECLEFKDIYSRTTITIL